MSADCYDVVIAGAGPAGCAAALVLHQAGLTVCLVDDAAENGFKIGESLPGAAQRLLRRLGFPTLSALLDSADFHPCTANASAWGSDRWTYTDAFHNPEGGGWHLNRAAFDAALRRTAAMRGVVRYFGRIGHVHKLPEQGYQLQFAKQTTGLPSRLTARWLVDATGRRAAIGRLLGASQTRFDNQIALVCWIKSPEDDRDQTTRIQSVADGWWYSTRLPHGRRVVSFHSLPQQIAKLQQDLPQFFVCCNETALLPYQISAENLLGKPKSTDAGVVRLDQTAGDSWLAVGDAALSVDPLSSQGIFFALYSGVRGAEAIVTAQQKKTTLATYQTQVDRVFAANQSARQHYYSSERRYLSNPYWRERFQHNKRVKKTVDKQ